jgi:hypothetical protein
VTDAEMIAFLEEAARTFEKRVLTTTEDREHWACVYNAENVRKIKDRFIELSYIASAMRP